MYEYRLQEAVHHGNILTFWLKWEFVRIQRKWQRPLREVWLWEGQFLSWVWSAS